MAHRESRSFIGKISNLLMVAIFLAGSASGLAPAQTAQTSTLEANGTHAVNSANPTSPIPSLTTLLNPAGSLHLSIGYRGSLDPRGWGLVSGKDEPPHFSPQSSTAPEDARWDEQFRLSIAGTDSLVYAIVVDGNGKVYIGGNFVVAGAVTVNHVAAWDGSQWQSLGSGMNGDVETLALDADGNLYAGGWFTTAGEVSANAVARWDGTAWSALGDGLVSGVTALAVAGDGTVYAGGWIHASGGTSIDNIAKWDGVSWSELGGGASHAVGALALDGNGNLYAGGWFTSTGGVPANHIAKWDGSAWSALGSGANSLVLALAIGAENELYAGGDFTVAGEISAKRVARWSNGSWSTLGSGVGDESGEAVRDLLLGVDGSIYACGWFTLPGAGVDTGIARWNGSQWSALSSNVPWVIALGQDLGSSDLYAGGGFAAIGNAPAQNIGRWAGSAWTVMGLDGVNGPNDEVDALILDGKDNLYLGGLFEFAGDVLVNHIALWDGETWSALGSGVDGPVYALALDGEDNLYAGGSFLNAGATSAPNIARWDGSQWSPLGSGMNDSLYAMVMDDDGILYAGGGFTTAGGSEANYIARWDGSQWSPLGAGVNSPVYGLALDEVGNLYAGGTFTSAGGQSANYVARWDGSQWWPLGDGANDIVTSLIVDKHGVLYAGGFFTTIGGVSANSVAAWAEDAWSPLGDGLSGNSSYVYKLAVGVNGVLYAGGQFELADGQPVNNVARWRKGEWQSLGSGTNGPVFAFTASRGGTLFIGGQFTMAGGKPSARLGRWINTPPTHHGESYAIDADASLDVPVPGVLGNDRDPENDPISVVPAGAPANGDLALIADGAFQYTPRPGFSGIDSFSYIVDDTFGYSADAVVFITVTATTTAPVAVGDIYSTTENIPLSVTAPGVLENDSHPVGDPLTATLGIGPIYGSLALQLDGSFVYTPTLDFTGLDYFTYIASDGVLTDTAVVTLTVTVNPIGYRIYLPLVQLKKP